MKLRDWLVQRGIKQVDFAKEIDISRAHLSCVISGSRPPGRKLARAIERTTNGEILANDVMTGEALGYSGSVKRVRGKQRTQEEPRRSKFLSLI